MTFHLYKSIPFAYGFRLNYSLEEIWTIVGLTIKVFLPFLYQEDFDTYHKEMWTYKNPPKSRHFIF